MSSSFLEIVELDDGDFALQRPDGGEPLVIISFSEELREYLQDDTSTVVKAMISAGVKASGAITRMSEEQQEDQPKPTLH